MPIPRRANLKRIVLRHPRGTTFCIKAGVHRMTSTVLFRPGDRFIGEPGAILNGSRLLTGWTQSGSFWVVSGQTQQHYFSGALCAGATTRCKVGDDVFVDDKPLQAVTDISQLGSGEFFFDYPNDKIYIADNPSGHKVEGIVANHAFSGCAGGAVCTGTLISGLIVEKFADVAIELGDGTVANNEVRLNHTVGIAIARDGVIRNNYVHDNGLEGVSSTGNNPRRNLLVEGNELARNGWYAGFDMGWEGGGGKWLFVNGLTIRGNYVHENNGRGLWTDTDNINVVIENNRIENNWAEGIEHERSYDAVIRNNTIRGNGFGNGGTWVFGAGIYVASSANVEIYGNVVEDNYAGIGAIQRELYTGQYGLQEVKNLYVHDNTIKTAGKNGLIQVIYDTSYYTSKNNRFVDNTYELSCNQPTPFAWKEPNGGTYYAYVTKNQWVGYGNDTTGTFSCRGR